MQIKTRMNQYLYKMGTIKKTRGNNVSKDVKKRELIHFWWEYKIV